MKKLTTTEFIQKANKVHNQKYDYSKSVYKNKKEKVIIICPIHGEFLQSPDGHFRGQGCPECKKQTISKQRRLTTSEFISKANEVHHNFYDYSKTVYVTAKEKCIIICPIHGEFLQDPSNHLAGKGCPRCGKEMMKNNFKYSENEILLKVQEEHPKYKFKIINYKGSDTIFECICPKHGVFIKTYNQLRDCDIICPICNGRGRMYEDIVAQFHAKHKYKYTYPPFEYINSNMKIDIMCPKHGVFKQTISHHLNGTGCPICKTSHGELFIYNYLTDKTILFYHQHILKLKNKLLKVDFYIPDTNTYIEFNGQQHYSPVDYFGGIQAFKLQEERDLMLRNYCQQNNINLLEIRYDLSQDQIIKLLEDNLKNKISCIT